MAAGAAGLQAVGAASSATAGKQNRRREVPAWGALWKQRPPFVSGRRLFLDKLRSEVVDIVSCARSSVG